LPPTKLNDKTGLVIATILTNKIVISHLRYMKRFLHRCLISEKRTTSKASWSQDQLKAALAAVRSGRKIREIGRQFDIHEATIRQQLKCNLTRGPKIGRAFTEEQERKLCDHMLQLSPMFYGAF
jgi:hypothetical protein